MQLAIHAPKIGKTESLSNHIEARMQAALGQYERRIRSVDVKVQDINANHGGSDKRCQVMVHFDRSGTVMAEDIQPDLYAAVSLAADKIKHAVSRELGRRRVH
ncbi:MAG: HPF/RaiA family ribosome-associated protein [Bacillota bacterium]